MKTRYPIEAGVCPRCGKPALEFGLSELMGNKRFYPVDCTECGWEGREWYKEEFCGFTTTDENGETVDVERVDEDYCIGCRKLGTAYCGGKADGCWEGG